MFITHKLQKMDLTRKGVLQQVEAMQDDRCSRRMEIPLMQKNIPWAIPADTVALIRYRKSDGTGGSYDTLPDGTKAYSFQGNKLTITLAPQVCAAPGEVLLTVALMQAGAEINTSAIRIAVQRNPGIHVVSEDYVRIHYMDRLEEMVQASTESLETANKVVSSASIAVSQAQSATEAATQAAENAQQAVETIQPELAQLQAASADSQQAIAELNEKKITKFYADSMGETHFPDSDAGHIQDMIIYGKSIQNGTPTPDSPVEIRSVVNPVVKFTGKNLWDEQWVIGYRNADTGEITNSKIAIRSVHPIPVEDTKQYVSNVIGFDKTVLYVQCYKDDGTYIGQKTVTNNTPFNPLQDSSYIHFNTDGSIKDYYGKIQIEEGSAATEYQPYQEQAATLPYTLNAIPVSSGGNVTMDGQQYIADYVDVESKRIVRMVDGSQFDNTVSIMDNTDWLLTTPIIIDLTDEEVQAFKDMMTYHPVTNVSVTSEQIDGAVTFHYPISMANGWNYIKEQLGDTRNYIYDMDLQSAEAYINSEYAVALAELEV